MALTNIPQASAQNETLPGFAGRAPLVTFAIIVALAALALLFTVAVPIGPMYWDHYLYLDAAKRIFDGQIPSVDFFTPVGALGYYLFAAGISLFPNGHALLIASWCLLFVSAPLMAAVIAQVQGRSNALAYAILLPFLLFSILPFNTGEFYPFPGSDGFGIYNRQVCQLLYVLASALLFMRPGKLLATVVALTMLALLFVKVTGFVAGTILCLTAFAAGRLALRPAVGAGVVFVGLLALLEVLTGIVSAYAHDIIALLDINQGSLLPRMAQAASLNFGILFAAGLLWLLLFAAQFKATLSDIAAFCRKPRPRDLARILNRPFVWLAAFIFAGLVFESQNTGSQAFIFLWPLLLKICSSAFAEKGLSRYTAAVAVLALAAVLPPAVDIVRKSARTWIGAVQNVTAVYPNLKTMGAVTIRPLQALRAERMRTSYIDDRATFRTLSDNGELASFLLFSDLDFQWLWLKNADEAVAAVAALEKDSGTRFETVMSIDFTNPFAWLMDKQAPRHIAIGADPFRAVPAPQEDVIAAVKAVDIALLPTCPPTTANMALLELYATALASNHTRIVLTPCYDAFVRNDR